MLQLLRHATAPPLQTPRKLRCSREARPGTVKHGSVRRSSVGELRAPTAERARFRSRAQSQPRRQSRPQSQSRTQSRVASADRSRYRARSCSGSCPLLPLLRQPIAPHPRTLPHLRPHEPAGSCTTTDGNVPLPSLDQGRAMSTQPIRARSCPQSQSWRQSRSQSQSRPQSQVLSASPLLLLRLFLLRILPTTPAPALSPPHTHRLWTAPQNPTAPTRRVVHNDGEVRTATARRQTACAARTAGMVAHAVAVAVAVTSTVDVAGTTSADRQRGREADKQASRWAVKQTGGEAARSQAEKENRVYGRLHGCTETHGSTVTHARSKPPANQ